ncbi:MAG: hypothetical protein AB7E68_03630 [Candidatus Babeliales bacterium]
MKNILYTFMFLSFAVANAHDENQPCYTISVVMHYKDTLATKWQEVTDRVAAVVQQFEDEEQNENTAESFSQDLTTVAQTIKALYELCAPGFSHVVTINVADKEEKIDTNENSKDVLVQVIFKLSKGISQEQRDAISFLVTNFKSLCTSSIEASLEKLDDIFQAIFVCAEEGRILINT